MRILVAIVIVLSFVPRAFAQECALLQISSLPMEGDPASGDGVVVPVKVNGAPLKFFVTTASNVTGISTAAVKRLGLQLKNSGQSFAYSGAGDEINHYIKFRSFELGVSADHNGELLVLPESFTPMAFDGVLGMDYLLNFDVEFDFKKRKLNFFSKDHCKGNVVYWTDAYAEIPFTLTDLNQIRIPVTLDGQRMQASLNMGGTKTETFLGTARTLFGLQENSPGVEEIKDADPHSETHFQYRFKSLDLDGVAVRNPLIQFIDDKMSAAYWHAHNDKVDHDPVARQNFPREDLILGMGILSKLRLYFAFKEQTLYVSAANAGK